MKKSLLIIPIALLFFACQSAPKNYSYFHTGNYTGIDTLINIDGYYITQRECDSTFFSMFMFYPDGLFTLATTSELLPELVDCFEQGGTSRLCRYPQWGNYRIDGNIIHTQTIITDGNGCTVFRDYKILPSGELVNISDYVDHTITNLGYMQNYPSYTENICGKPAKFVATKTKRSEKECPYIEKGWFRAKK